MQRSGRFNATDDFSLKPTPVGCRPTKVMPSATTDIRADPHTPPLDCDAAAHLWPPMLWRYRCEPVPSPWQEHDRWRRGLRAIRLITDHRPPSCKQKATSKARYKSVALGGRNMDGLNKAFMRSSRIAKLACKSGSPRKCTVAWYQARLSFQAAHAKI